MGRGGGIEEYFGSNKHNGAIDGIRGQKEADQTDQNPRRTAVDVSDPEDMTTHIQAYSQENQGEERNQNRTEYTDAEDEDMIEEDTEGYHTANEQGKTKRWGTDD